MKVMKCPDCGAGDKWDEAGGKCDGCGSKTAPTSTDGKKPLTAKQVSTAPMFEKKK